MTIEPGVQPTSGDPAASTDPTPVGRGIWIKAGVLALILVLGGLAVLYFGFPDVDAVRRYVEGMGVWAPVVFIVGFVLLTTMPIPKSVFAVLAGILWGMAWGVVISVVAALLGASLSFLIARYLGRDAVIRLAGHRLDRIDPGLYRRGWLGVLGARLVPILPFTLLNYAFGVTSVRFGSYFLGTALASIPGTSAYVAVGAFGATPYSWQFWVALGGLLSLTVVGLLLARRRSRQRSDSRDTEQAPPVPVT